MRLRFVLGLVSAILLASSLLHGQERVCKAPSGKVCVNVRVKDSNGPLEGAIAVFGEMGIKTSKSGIAWILAPQNHPIDLSIIPPEGYRSYHPQVLHLEKKDLSIEILLVKR